MRLAVVLVCASSLLACGPGPDPADAGADREPCPDAHTRVTLVPTPPVQDVDLLFVIDNSSSMREEQRALRHELARMVAALASGDHDGLPETPGYPTVRSLRVGVVSTDLGVGGVGIVPGDPMIRSCGGTEGSTADEQRARYGDDGVLQRVPIGAPFVDDETDCDGPDEGTAPDVLTTEGLPAFLTFDPTGGEQTSAQFAQRAACYAMLGTGGCGFEQQLESMLKALTPSTAPTTFLAESGTSEDRGQGDRLNAGWLRANALLAVVMVTDEDDCSAADARVFDWGAGAPYHDDPPNGMQANTRCARFGDEPIADNPNGSQPSLLRPLPRYADGLVALKGGDAAKVVFTLIAGVPVDSVNRSDPDGSDDGVRNLDAILDPSVTPAMAITLATLGPTPNAGIVPSCSRCAFGLPAATCALGWNDLDQDGVNAPDCVDEVGGTPNICDPGEALHCTAEINGIEGCQIDETELPAQRAVPPRRLVRAARAMQEAGVAVVVQSICQDTFAAPVTAVLERISATLVRGCVTEAPARADDRVDCRLEERLPVGASCASLRGRARVRTEDRAEICTLTQVAIDDATRASHRPPASAAAGFYFDDFTELAANCGQAGVRVALTHATPEAEGATYTLTCDVPLACE